jgi:lipopolysaccharide biosynthesis glycosyltransferase
VGRSCVERLVFFTTDEGYLFPTLHAALQVARTRGVIEIADIAVFLVGLNPELSSKIRSDFEPYGLTFFDVDPDSYSLVDYDIFAAGHVPPSALARLVVSEYIPHQYEHLIYLDGDILIVGDPTPLIRHDVAPGKILAAGDANMVCSSPRGRSGSDFRSYAETLGVAPVEDYFNSGVLAARRETYAGITAAAMSYLRANTRLCRYHDQSALNAVTNFKREALHPSFNYAPLIDAVSRGEIEPRIIHFLGRSKPWQRACTLWGGRWFESYARFAAEHPFLREYWKDGTEAQRYPASPRTLKGRLQLLLQTRNLKRYLRRTDFAVSP